MLSSERVVNPTDVEVFPNNLLLKPIHFTLHLYTNILMMLAATVLLRDDYLCYSDQSTDAYATTAPAASAPNTTAAATATAATPAATPATTPATTIPSAVGI